MSTFSEENDGPSEHELRDRILFDSISSDYVRKDLTRSSRIARKLRLNESLAAAGVPDTSIILEVGCGGGFSAEYLKGKFTTFYGVDYSSELIRYARSRNDAADVQFFDVNIKDFEPPELADVIIMIGVLHHLDDIPKTLDILLKMLKPGGTLIANEPHPRNPLVSLSRAVRKQLDPKYSADQCELTVSEMEHYLDISGFEDLQSRPQGFFSTPFAEVIVNPQGLTAPLSRLACLLDRILAKIPKKIGFFLSWNAIVSGKRPLS